MATREQLIEDFADHKYATGEKFARLINSMKVVQEPVADPAASGTSLSFIDSIEQDKDGKITATKKTLDLANAHELNPFKGWWKTGDTLPTSGFDGAYLYFKDTTQSPAVTTIYQWNGTTYADTGTEVDESNVQTFGSGQQVNAVKIKDENGEESSSAQGVLSAEAGERIADVLTNMYSFGVQKYIVGFYMSSSSPYTFVQGDNRGLLIPIVKGVNSIKVLLKDGVTTQYTVENNEPTVGGTPTSRKTFGTTNIPYLIVSPTADNKYIFFTIPSGRGIDDTFQEITINGFNLLKNHVDLFDMAYRKTRSIFLDKPAVGADTIKELYLEGLDDNEDYHIDLGYNTATSQYNLYIYDSTDSVARVPSNNRAFVGEIEPLHDSGIGGRAVLDFPKEFPKYPMGTSVIAKWISADEQVKIVKEFATNLNFSPTIKSILDGGGESNIKPELNNVIGTDNLENLADTLITGWESYRNYLIDRGYADKEYHTRAADGNNTYFVSNAFSVEKGTIIEFEGNGTTTIPQGVVLIQNATTKEPLLMTDLLNDANAAVGVGSYRYIISYDMSIQLCTKTPYNDVLYYKIYKSGIQDDNERMRTTYPIAFADSDEYRDLMSQATKVDSYNGSDSELTTGWKDTQVTLLHYSDIHGDSLRVKRILEFRKKYSTPDSVIDDVICTGDVCPSRFSDYVDFSTLNSDGYNRVLQVIGNHDVHGSDDQENNYVTEQQKYERYMANVGSWGVVQPSDIGVNNYYPCYYYKDYTANRTYGPDAGNASLRDTYKQRVRLIVLDAMIKSTDTDNDNKQKKWFAATLLDAKTNGKHVVVADHFAPRTSFAGTNHFDAGGFDCITDEWGGLIGNFGIGISNYAEIVDKFMNGGVYTVDGTTYDFGTGGGEFVCWLCGHFHWDMVGTTTTYPEQVFIAVGSASVRTPMQHRARVIGEESEDLFNIVSIDTFRKHIRVFRVGAKWDRYLEHAGTMCISYDNSGNNVPRLVSHF